MNDLDAAMRESKLAMPCLYQQVQARFDADGSDVLCRWGAKAQARQIEGRAERACVWVPGDDHGRPQSSGSADLGSVRSAKQPGRFPRPLATLGELATVYLWAADRRDPDAEFPQYEEARQLWNAWFRAVYHAARGTFTVKSSAWWSRSGAERRYGLAIRSVLELDAAVVDIPLGSPHPRTIVTGLTGRKVNVTLLDRTEPVQG